MYKGIDVSENQGVIDWKKVKSAGVQFAILRTVKRSGNPDGQLKANIDGCIKNNIPFDFYKYSYAVTEAAAVAEVKRVVEVLKSYGIKPSTDYIVWMDVEDAVQIALSTEKLTSIVQSFKKAVLDAGFGFGLYMGKYHFENNEVNFPLLGETHAWIARYYNGYNVMQLGTMPNEKYKPTVKNGKLWGWQYTSSGRVDGISGNVDMNVAYYDIIPHNTVETVEPTDAITEIAKEVIAGKWGIGHENRKESIYKAVRKEVNRLSE